MFLGAFNSTALPLHLSGICPHTPQKLWAANPEWVNFDGDPTRLAKLRPGSVSALLQVRRPRSSVWSHLQFDLLDAFLIYSLDPTDLPTPGDLPVPSDFPARSSLESSVMVQP